MSIAGAQTERKIAILEALGRCLLKKSFQDTTLKDIAKMAGITHGAIGYYFKSKEDILLNYIDYLLIKYIYFSDKSDWFKAEHLDSIPPEKITETVLQFNLGLILSSKDDLKIALELASIANYNKAVEERIKSAFAKIEKIEFDILLRSGMDQESAALLSKTMISIFAGIGMCAVALKYDDKQLADILHYLTKFWKTS
ncbi:MAG: TetR/AcrR family transcriptional regulator [bacterium]|nr:TetR/AcrR family transcriptional regulator [bacterium]